MVTSSVQPWVKAGLAVEAPAEDDTGITFPLEWGTKQFNAFLRDLFPRLFEYLGTTNPSFATLPNEPDATGKRRVEYSLPYVLLFKVRKNYSVVDATHPSAVKYMEVANGLKDGLKDGGPEDGQKDGSRKNSSFRTKSLFFGVYPPPCHLKGPLLIATTSSHQRPNFSRGAEQVVFPRCRSNRYPPCLKSKGGGNWNEAKER